MGTFGERLREPRVYRGITQEQLAEMADIARTMVGRYETTDQMPSIETLVHIADALNVSTDYLLGRTESIGQSYVPKETAAPRPSRRMPRNVEELERFIQDMVETILKDQEGCET